MFSEKRVMFLVAETPVHAGSGNELGIVDLPIQRERYTDFPKIEGSSLKGSLREAFSCSEVEIDVGQKKFPVKSLVNEIFGPDGEEETYAGSFVITDARILLFPVKSLKGVFAWITSPMVLKRFARDLSMAGLDNLLNEFGLLETENLANTVPGGSEVTLGQGGSSDVILEEFTFKVSENKNTNQLAKKLAEKIFPEDNASLALWRDKLAKNLVVLADDHFKGFVKFHTEVITRTKIDPQTGTVATGALWTEEYLPQDSVLYSILMFTQPRFMEKSKKLNDFISEKSPVELSKWVADVFLKGLPKVIQVGGNQTIGKGFVRTVVI
ncbi:MAG: type III-B CRISPR module RAMP protein Cmr4 [candidate division WOR-3 bacterium]